MRSARLALLLGSLVPVAGAQRPPSIVLVLADDLGIGDPRCYSEESRIPTPHLDAIAEDGLRMLDMHSPSAVCSPTRYGLLTGRYAWRTRLKNGVLDGYSRLLIEPDRLTLPEMLRRRGYATSCVGKWHLGLGDRYRTDYAQPLRPGPLQVGFERFCGIPASLDMPPYVWIEGDRPVRAPSARVRWSGPRREGGKGFWRAGAAAPGFRHADVLPAIERRALGELERLAAQERPFFLYVALSAPHLPWLPAPPYEGRSGAGPYGDFVVMVDAVVGRLDAAIERLGLREEVLLIVTSDNGAHWTEADVARTGHRANGTFRGQKADIFEGGHRVPFLVRWPGRVPAGAVSNVTACLTDVMPSLAAIAGCELPEDAAEDGFDVSPAWLGETDVRRGAPVVHHAASGMFAIRDGRWKLVAGRGSGGFTRPVVVFTLDPEAPRGQLYDLEADPGETRDVWRERPEVVARLEARLRAIRRAEGSR